MPQKEISLQEPENRSESSSVRILAADESSDNRFLLSAFLKGFNCELLLAENGQEALDTFKQGEFDIVLMDMQMPVMDGFVAPPVLALTAYALPDEIKQCTDAGCDGHISKPVRKKNLLHLIEDFTQQRGVNKGFDLEILFQEAEKLLHLVPFPVNTAK